MEHVTKRLCPSCEDELSEAAPSQQKYCSSTCRERMKKRRKRLKAETTDLTELQRLQSVEQQYDRLQVEYRKLRQRLEGRNRKIRRLEHALSRAELQVETAADEQAQRTRVVRDELAASRTELAAVKRNWSIKGGADRTDETVTDLRTQLAMVTDEYNELATKYVDLSRAAKNAATERKYLQGVVRQWDSLCKRLNTATGGRPRKETDQKILATWKRFRRAVGS